MAETMHIYDKGGRVKLLTLDGVVNFRYERVEDDISQAFIRLNTPGPECVTGLERITPMRHEVVITDQGRRVWEGPITLYKERGSIVEITAQDVLFYTRRAAMRRVWKSMGPKGETEAVPHRLERIIRGEMARFEIEPAVNVVNHVHAIVDEDTARTTRQNHAYEKYVWDEMDEMAWRNGVDYTTAGREIYIHDTHTPLGTLRRFTDADFAAPPELAIYGAELATQTIVTDRQGRAAFGGIGRDDYYGRVELLHGTYYDAPGEEADDQTHVPIEEMRDQARRDFSGRYPMPVVLRVPENVTLNMDTFRELSHELVPGVRIPLTLTTAVRKVTMLMKLRRVRVFHDDEEGYRCEVTLVPAPEGSGAGLEGGGEE